MSPSIFFFLGVCNVHFPFFIFIFTLSPESEREREREQWWRDGFDLCELLLHPDAYVLFPLLLLLLRSSLLYGSCINVHCTHTHTHTSHQGIRFLMARYHRANKRRRRRQLLPLPNKRGRHKYKPNKSKFRMYRENGHEMLLSLSRQIFIVTLQLISQTRSCSSAKLLRASAIFSI